MTSSLLADGLRSRTGLRERSSSAFIATPPGGLAHAGSRSSTTRRDPVGLPPTSAARCSVRIRRRIAAGIVAESRGRQPRLFYVVREPDFLRFYGSDVFLPWLRGYPRDSLSDAGGRFRATRHYRAPSDAGVEDGPNRPCAARTNPPTSRACHLPRSYCDDFPGMG
jgi:hypothetical protein